MSWLKLLIWNSLFIAWCVLLGGGHRSVPTLLRLLDPHAGLWSHREHTLDSQTLPGLTKSVAVYWDAAGVPHFFAQDEADLYRVQGFVMASQRLFQIDLITRQAAGRLSELVGEKTLEYDRYFMRFGLRSSAERTLATFMKTPETAIMINAFVDGINAYVASLKTLPPEYVLLGARPKTFQPIDVVFMDKSLTYNLSGRSFALDLSQLQQKLGTQKVLELFPEFLPKEFEDYILTNPGLPLRRPERAADFPFVTALKAIPKFPLANPSNGSNNWAVSPAKSTTGHSILANDTHLGYSLPNIWYENQLSTPSFNVYGASLVAVPGIVNGMNANIAWGPTNGTTTVLDFFEVEFENETSWRYLDHGQLRDAQVREERLSIKGGKDETISVIETHLGYVLHREGKLGLVANWMGHRSREELRALHGLYTAKTYKDCLKSFGHWAVPIQNFICADQDHVSIRHTGRVPKRNIGEGRFIMDGRAARDTLADEVPEAKHPQAVDVPYVLSANQKIEDPRYPYYLGWDYEEPFRGMMIRRRLEAKPRLSPDDMMRIQNDAFDAEAQVLLPGLLKNLRTSDLTEPQARAARALEEWSYQVEPRRTEPALFKVWLKRVGGEVFGETVTLASGRRVYPKSMRLAWLLRRLSTGAPDTDQQWLSAPLGELVTRAFQSAWGDLTDRLGPDPKDWTWMRYNQARVPHVLRVPGFGSDVLEMAGSGQSIRGNNGTHGPVYKAVFALGEWPRAWMQVPGGNDGDPFSPTFERGVKEWSEGRMREVEFYKNEDEAKAKAARVIELKPAGG